MRESLPTEDPSAVDPPPVRSWRAAAAALAAVMAILAAATLAGTGAAAVFDGVVDLGGARAFAAGELASLTTLRLAVFLAAFQVIALALTFAAARLFASDTERLVGLTAPRGGAAATASAVAMLMVFAAAYGVSVYWFDRKPLLGDIQLFADMMRADLWWTIALVAVIGAPLAEEALFRGLMYGVLRETPLGKVAAAVVTAFVWASVHAQYSGYGLTAIFLIGLYLAYVRERTDSLLPPIACHAAYNGMIVAVLLATPAHVLQP